MTAEPYNPYFSQLDDLQKANGVWLGHVNEVLGVEPDLQMRLRRFAEEAAELCQAGGLDMETFINVALDAYDRPVGHYPQEFMTHRVFSRNASSSRAIPVKRLLADIRIDTPEMIQKIAAKQAVKAARGI